MDLDFTFTWDNGIVVDEGNYDEYMRSSAWRWFRGQALEAAKNRCQRCGYTKGLEVHHKHYDSLGREELRDVKVLCKRCHVKADRQRERINARETRYRNGLDTYIEKVYGRAEILDGDEEEFDEWLEGKEYGY